MYKRPAFLDRHSARRDRPSRLQRPAFLDRPSKRRDRASSFKRPAFMDRSWRFRDRPKRLSRPGFLDRKGTWRERYGQLQRPDWMDRSERQVRPGRLDTLATVDKVDTVRGRVASHRKLSIGVLLGVVVGIVVLIIVALGVGPFAPEGASGPAAAPAIGDPSSADIIRSAVPKPLATLPLVAPPTAMAGRPGDAGLFVAERAGRIWQVPSRPGSEAEPAVAIDLTPETDVDAGHGLLGLATSIDGTFLYVSITSKDGTFHVLEFATTPQGVDPASRREVLAVPHPDKDGYGGALLTLPDGTLLIGLGDGNVGGNTTGASQDTSTLLGKILRIEPRPGTTGQPYTVPEDNPFVGKDGRPEIWAVGVHAPVSMSIGTDANLWVADTGGERVDEINRLPKFGRGANLGWDIVEGDFRLSGVPSADDVRPVATSLRNPNCRLAPGAAYQGRNLPFLRGQYVYGKTCTSSIERLIVDKRGSRSRILSFLPVGQDVLLVGLDGQGQPMVVATNGGLYRMEAERFDLGLAANDLQPPAAVPPSKVTSACGTVQALYGLRTLSTVSPVRARQLVDGLLSTLTRYQQNAPAEVLPHLTTLLQQSKSYSDALAAAGDDPRAPVPASLYQEYGERPDLVAAFQGMQEWESKNC